MKIIKIAKKAMSVPQEALDVAEQIQGEIINIAKNYGPNTLYRGKSYMGNYEIINPYLDDLTLKLHIFIISDEGYGDNPNTKNKTAFLSHGSLKFYQDHYEASIYVNVEEAARMLQSFYKIQDDIEKKKKEDPARYGHTSPEFFAGNNVYEWLLHEITHALDPKVVKNLINQRYKYNKENTKTHPIEIDAYLRNALQITKKIVTRAIEKGYSDSVKKELQDTISNLSSLIPKSIEDVQNIASKLPSSLGNYGPIIAMMYYLKERGRENDVKRMITILYNEWNQLLDELQSV